MGSVSAGQMPQVSLLFGRQPLGQLPTLAEVSHAGQGGAPAPKVIPSPEHLGHRCWCILFPAAAGLFRVAVCPGLGTTSGLPERKGF